MLLYLHHLVHMHNLFFNSSFKKATTAMSCEKVKIAYHTVWIGPSKEYDMVKLHPPKPLSCLCHKIPHMLD